MRNDVCEMRPVGWRRACKEFGIVTWDVSSLQRPMPRTQCGKCMPANDFCAWARAWYSSFCRVSSGRKAGPESNAERGMQSAEWRQKPALVWTPHSELRIPHFERCACLRTGVNVKYGK